LYRISLNRNESGGKVVENDASNEFIPFKGNAVTGCLFRRFGVAVVRACKVSVPW
jgi:hypothetical protein